MRISDFTSDNYKYSSTIIFVVALLLAFWFYAKFQSDGNSIISLEITENEEIILNGNPTSFQDLSSVAKHLISELKNQGISKDEIVIAFHADRSLSMGIITDVQQELKKCALNKIIYEK